MKKNVDRTTGMTDKPEACQQQVQQVQQVQLLLLLLLAHPDAFQNFCEGFVGADASEQPTASAADPCRTTPAAAHSCQVAGGGGLGAGGGGCSSTHQLPTKPAYSSCTIIIFAGDTCCLS
jgi:hypothetical protein